MKNLSGFDKSRYLTDGYWAVANADYTWDGYFPVKVKSHRGEPLNEAADELSDLGRTIGPEHAVWTGSHGFEVDRWAEKCTHVNLESGRGKQSVSGCWKIHI